MKRDPIDECRQQLQVLMANLDTMEDDIGECNGVHDLGLYKDCCVATLKLTAEVNSRLLTAVKHADALRRMLAQRLMTQGVSSEQVDEIIDEELKTCLS